MTGKIGFCIVVSTLISALFGATLLAVCGHPTAHGVLIAVFGLAMQIFWIGVLVMSIYTRISDLNGRIDALRGR